MNCFKKFDETKLPKKEDIDSLFEMSMLVIKIMSMLKKFGMKLK